MTLMNIKLQYTICIYVLNKLDGIMTVFEY